MRWVMHDADKANLKPERPIQPVHQGNANGTEFIQVLILECDIKAQL
jgi:hypothetical protein